ncbi:MAG TPA: phosphate ABC transporter substrate-binding protein PstS, partial [Candidatus Limnocylindrales bacterium]|nr:phosphate ABC transporter substrate-binding protein PstS [Candidatus Limnocylindrales bacterium]
PTVAPGQTSTASSGPTAPLPPTGNLTLTGAGATFPALLYQVWIEKFATAYPNVQIDYQAIGSGGGIKAITQQTVDFGASDAAMKDSEIAALPTGTKILHIPTALGAVVVTYNIKGSDGAAISGLQLDADNIAGIFLGHITTWNDPAIVANNADLASKLPATPILVVHRSDGSGTTNAFTTYLDTVNAEWHTNVGAGKEVKWPVGNGAPGNDGVSAGVKQTDGAVGYVELEYASISGLQSAKVKNAAGKFVGGSVEGVTAAANAIVDQFPADFRQAPIINGAGDTTYPIASYTYILAYVDQGNATKSQALVAFLYWALTDGQAEEKGIGYAPLPAAVQQKALAELHQITSGGNAIWPG